MASPVPSDFSSTTITISWTLTGATGYSLIVTDPYGVVVMNSPYSSTVSSAIFTGNSDTTYLFALTTTLNSGSVYSATTTVQATTYPAALSNVIPIILTSTSVTVEFSPSPGADSYSFIFFAQRFAFSPSFLVEPLAFNLMFFLFVGLQHWTAVDPGLSFHNSTRTE